MKSNRKELEFEMINGKIKKKEKSNNACRSTTKTSNKVTITVQHSLREFLTVNLTSFFHQIRAILSYYQKFCLINSLNIICSY